MTEAGMVRIIIDLDRCNLWTCQRDSRQLKCQMSGIVPAMFASNCRNRSSNLIKTLVGIYPAALVLCERSMASCFPLMTQAPHKLRACD